MKNYRRRKFTTYKFFVEGQICKIFFQPQKEFEKGFWIWNVGFAVGKSNRQLNDWYWKRKNKRSRSLDRQITGKSGIKTYLRCFQGVLKMRWILQPGDVLYCDCTSLKPNAQFTAGIRWHRNHPDWTIDYDKKIFFWHRPPYSNDPIWNDYVVIPKTPANPLQSMANSQYFDSFSLLPKDQYKAKSKDQN